MRRFLPAVLLFMAVGIFSAPGRTHAEDESGDGDGTEEGAEPLPDYPFPDLYAVPRPRAIGTAAGQLRLTAGAGSTLDADEIEWVARLGVERVFDPWMALRVTGQANVPTGGVGPALSLRTGPVLHTRPYRRVDVAAWVEGGILSREVMTATGSHRRAGPTLAAGSSFLFTPSAYWFLDVGVQYGWSSAEPGSPRRSWESFLTVGYIL